MRCTLWQRQSPCGLLHGAAKGRAPSPDRPCDGWTGTDRGTGQQAEGLDLRIAMIGGGYVGLELGSVWRRLGSEVTVLVRGETLLAGQEPAIAALAAEYLRAFMWGMPFFGAFVVLRGFLAAMERPRPALLVAFAGVGVNAPLVWALVFGEFGAPRLGVFGAGLASFLVNLLMPLALLGLIARDRQLRRFRLLGRLWRPDWPRFREVFRVGLPIAGQMWLEIGLFAGAALVVGLLGAVPVARPWIVVTLLPSACTASTLHDFTLRPSRCTVQAPQLLVSHPTTVPVFPSFSRR